MVLALSLVICVAGLACFWVVRYLADLWRPAILAQTYENCDYGVVISGLDGVLPGLKFARMDLPILRLQIGVQRRRADGRLIELRQIQFKFQTVLQEFAG